MVNLNFPQSGLLMETKRGREGPSKGVPVMGRRDGMSQDLLSEVSGGPGGIPGSLRGQERETDGAGCPATSIPVFHASASAGALSEGPSRRWGTGDHCGPGLGARPSSPRRIPMRPADGPPIAAPRARPGSTQTVLTAPAAKVLLRTCYGHLHAGWPGRGRGLPGGGRGERMKKPKGEQPGV